MVQYEGPAPFYTVDNYSQEANAPVFNSLAGN